jgi:hypothetical protein
MILLGKEFTIVTDHSALQWLNKHRGDNAYLLKWSLALQEYYPFDIKWRPGRKHGAPDTLSRFPIVDESVNLLYLDNSPEIIKLQSQDKKLKPYIQYLTEGILPSDRKLRRKLLDEITHFTIYDNILYHIWKPDAKNKNRGHLKKRTVIPEVLKLEVMKKAHEECGHFGPWKTLELLRERCYWDNMAKDVTEHIQFCESCQKTKGALGDALCGLDWSYFACCSGLSIYLDGSRLSYTLA